MWYTFISVSLLCTVTYGVHVYSRRYRQLQYDQTNFVSGYERREAKETLLKIESKLKKLNKLRLLLGGSTIVCALVWYII